MPSEADIIEGLTQLTNRWVRLAVVWHVAIAAALVALALGWRPTRRQSGVLLALPLLSVSGLSWLAENPFNGTLFALAAVVLGVIGLRLPSRPVPRATRPAALLGGGMIAFAWLYPHFLEGGPVWRYLYAAPVGLIPCPTLSALVGFSLLGAGLGSRAWSLVLATTGAVYGAFGAFRLGVPIDLVLLAGSVALAMSAVHPVRPRTPETPAP